MVRIIHGLFLFCCLFWQCALAQSLQFFSEKIKVTIHEEYAEVNGEYHFKNNSSQAVKRTLFYPFVISKNLPYPDSISVICVGTDRAISFSKQNRGIFFTVEVHAESTIIYKVFYSQQAPSQKMEYILTTTQHWNQPLIFAEYIIKLPQQLLLKYLSLNPSEMAVDGDYQIYSVFKDSYMPNSNLIVEWARREE